APGTSLPFLPPRSRPASRTGLLFSVRKREPLNSAIAPLARATARRRNSRTSLRCPLLGLPEQCFPLVRSPLTEWQAQRRWLFRLRHFPSAPRKAARILRQLILASRVRPLVRRHRFRLRRMFRGSPSLLRAVRCRKFCKYPLWLVHSLAART